MAGFLSGLARGYSDQLDNRNAADAYAPLLDNVYGAQSAPQGGGFLASLFGGGNAQPVASGAPAPIGGAAPQFDRAAVAKMLANPATREAAVSIIQNRGNLPTPKDPNLTDDLREYAAARGQGYKGSFLDYQTHLKQVGAARTNINVNAGGDNRQVFDAVGKSYEGANAALTGLNAIREGRAALNAGGIFGAGADLRLGLQKLGASLGVADTAPITNTETFRAAIAPQVAAMLKATVGSTQISNSDREFAEKAAGGSITLDPSSIGRLMDIAERAQKGIIEAHNKRLDLVYPASNPNVQRERALYGVTIPDYPAMTPPPAPAAAARPAVSAGVPAPKTKAEYDALPSGTRFTDPDGKTRIKP